MIGDLLQSQLKQSVILEINEELKNTWWPVLQFYTLYVLNYEPWTHAKLLLRKIGKFRVELIQMIGWAVLLRNVSL
jgi:hypothetical protein